MSLRIRLPAKLVGAGLMALCFTPVAGLADTSRANVVGVVPLGTVEAGGFNSRGDLLRASDGNLYLTTTAGGSRGYGAVMKVTPAGAASVLYSFEGTTGYSPYSGLMQASDGALYGTTYFGGARNLGTVYRVTLDGTFTLLASFDNRNDGGFFPYAGLTQLGDGDLYGTTMRGGPSDAGTVFRISLTGTVTPLHSFNGNDGRNPQGRLAVGPDGALYGTTLLGGPDDRGTIFRISPDGTLTTLFAFPRLGEFTEAGRATNETGSNPRSGLILGADGNFYGTAYQGGAHGYGTVFRITPSGSLTTLHSFAGPPFGGAGPLGGVAQLPDGSLVGTTEGGGAQGRGTTWRIDTAGNFTVLHSFSGLVNDGSVPYATLLPLDGNLYGVSYTDALSGPGSVFRIVLPDAGGTLPVTVTTTPDTIVLGASATLSWDSVGAVRCGVSEPSGVGGVTSGDVAVSGSQTVTPQSAGVFYYGISCTDAAEVVHNAYAALRVTAPEAQPVDGGGDGGGGAVSPALLALLAGALGFMVRQRRQA